MSKIVIYNIGSKHKKHKKKKTQLILTTIINNFKIKIYSIIMTFETKQFMDTILTLVDHDTQQPIEASFAAIELTSSDPSIFTVDSDVDADGTLDVVGVAEGEASLHVKATATYVDSKTGQSVTADKETDVTVTVTAPPVDAESTDLVVSFTGAQPIPVV